MAASQENGVVDQAFGSSAASHDFGDRLEASSFAFKAIDRRPRRSANGESLGQRRRQ
jgi:hypothetical protein